MLNKQTIRACRICEGHEDSTSYTRNKEKLEWTSEVSIHVCLLQTPQPITSPLAAHMRRGDSNTQGQIQEFKMGRDPAEFSSKKGGGGYIRYFKDMKM